MSIEELLLSRFAGLAPYEPGRPIASVTRELGLTDVIKLASNENPLGPSPLALLAAQKTLAQAALYPESSAPELKAALFSRFGVPLDAITVGNGSNDVLDLVARALLSAGDEVVIPRYAFAIFKVVAKVHGAKVVEAPDKHFGHDLDAIRELLGPRTRMVFLANPNNPTGTFVDLDKIYDFLEGLPPHVLLVLDEAYIEYLPEDARSQSLSWLPRFPNLFVTRTFSKIHGLAGFRVGYGFGHPALISIIERIRPSFNVNAMAQAAARAALLDTAHERASLEMNGRSKKILEEALLARGIPFLPSFANFLCLEVGDGDKFFSALLRQGVIVRPLKGYGMPRHVRITLGTPGQMQRLFDAMEKSGV